jgi:hypothetical protein
MKWSQLDQNQVDADLISWKTFRPLYLKVEISFGAGCLVLVVMLPQVRYINFIAGCWRLVWDDIT